MKRVSPWTIVLLLLVVETAAGQRQSGWRAGVASVPITPNEPIWLAGYGSRERPSGEVLQDIHAKALALEDETGAVTVLVTIDLLGFSRLLSDQVAERAWQEYGLSRDRIGLNFSHTHSGPVVGEVLRSAYPLKEEHLQVVRGYTKWVLDEIVKVIGQSMESLSQARLFFGQGSAGFAVNRRRVRTGKRHLPGPVDHDVPVLAVRGADGGLRAVVFGYACHATVLSDYQINGDWPGFAQESLQEKHPGAAALFVTGCGADANPLPRRSVQLAKSYGQILAYAVDLVLDGEMAPVRGPLKSAFERVAVPFSKPPSQRELEARVNRETGMAKRHAQFLLDRIEREGRLPGSYPYPIQVWQFGNDFTLIHLAGEVVVDYSLRLKASHGWDTVWVAGYSNEVFAYIPSLRVLKEGGYEGAGAMIPYGQSGPFGAPVEEIIVEKVGQLMERTGAATSSRRTP